MMKTTKKTFFIVPGFKQNASGKYFAWLATFLKKLGFRVVCVPVRWDYRTMSDYVADFCAFYRRRKTEINYILGFSYGAVMTFISATELQPDKIYLCSLSPDFREDLPRLETWIKKWIGKRRIADNKRRSGREIAKRLAVPTVVFYGEAEARDYPSLKIRCKETARLAKYAKLVVVKNSLHDIRNPEYKKAIEKEIKTLSSGTKRPRRRA